MANLETTYMGLKLRNPLIAGSCGLTDSLTNIKAIADNGIGAIVIKSMFEEQIHIETEKYIKNGQGNVNTSTKTADNLIGKRIYDYDEAYSYIYDYAKNNTLEKYLSLISEAKKSIDVPIIASINCVSNYDWQSFAKRIQDAGADALELNIYILPSDFRRSGDENENVYFDIINEVKKFITIPFAVKIGYYFSSLAQTVQKLSETGTKGLVLFNRPYNTDIDIEKISLSAGNIYSSDFEYNHTLRWISILSGKISCDLSASTGVHNYETAIKMLLAGATTVQMASVFYKHGFIVVGDFLARMNDWMNRHHFNSISDFRGKLSKNNLENPAAIERVQFMKLYSGIE
ncbi:MAG: dihydroorotate dehydrogenase-like protein [Bacteroidales bacterium]|nr:dihydroorotate dehydrogenase-like protein [Bacteroidales bacterium]